MSALKKVTETQDFAPVDYPWKEKMLADKKLVKGKFINRECPGGELKFSLRLYKGPVEKYTLVDGREYELPLGVVKHLVNNCQREEDTDKPKMLDPYTGQPLYEKKMIPRFSFVTSEYLE